jgi:hypothetical protein
VGIHEDNIARVAYVPVDTLADPVKVIHDRALRSVAHENLVARITSSLEAGHAYEVVNAEVIDPRGVGPLKNVCPNSLVKEV